MPEISRNVSLVQEATYLTPGENQRGVFFLGLATLRFCEADGPTGRPLGCFYFEDEPVGASGAACCSGGLDPPSMECVAVVLSSSARAQTHAKLTRKARVSADSTLVLSTKDISLHMPLKKETSLPCSGSQSPIA